MKYLCIHGYIRPDCTVCTEIEEAVNEFMVPEEYETYDDFLYDAYLELDEKLLSESEEN